MTTRPNKVSHFNWVGQKIEPGTRVRVKSRHGTIGNGTVTAILGWANTPFTICVEMDADTVYATQVENNWPSDEIRIPDTGLFGGEIKEILKKN